MKPIASSQPGATAAWGYRLILGGLSLFAVLTFLPLLRPVFFPWHDTLYGFELFHYFYSEYFFHGDIANWLAYDSFGLPSNHDQLFSLSILNYLLMVVGKAFRITDALWLFKLSILGEILLFLLGMFLLSGELFKHKKTVFLVCLLALTRAPLMKQLYFDFRIYYLFPVTVYFLLMFFRRKRAGFLWLAGLSLFAWELGNVLYFIFLWIVLLFVFFAVCFLQDKKIWRSALKMKVWEWGALFALLVVAGTFFAHLKDLRSFIDLAPRGPDGKAALSNYIHWGGVHDIGSILRWHLLGDLPERFVGLWPVAFLGLAMAKVRSRDFAAFLTLFLLLLWLSFGGIFSALCYYLPGVGFYRHIGLTHGLSKILIVICSGFAMDLFWEMDARKKTVFLAVVGVALIFVADAWRVTGGWFTDLAFSKTAGVDLWSGLTGKPEILRLTVYLFVLSGLVLAGGLASLLFGKSDRDRRRLARVINGAIIVCICADVVVFQIMTDRKAWRLPERYHELLYTCQVHAPEYQPMRSNEPVTQRQKDAYALANRPSIDAVYTSAYNFIQLDPCHSEFFTHMTSLSFSQLLKTRKALNQDLLMTLGCYTSKIRLVPNAVFVQDTQEGMAVMNKMPRLFETLVLTGNPINKEASSNHQPGLPDRPAMIESFSANQLSFTIDVPYRPGAWLVYADSFHPGWRAFVDGNPAEIFPAQLAFKAVWLDNGAHKVCFVFAPEAHQFRSVLLAVFGGLAALLLLVLGFMTFMKGHPKIS